MLENLYSFLKKVFCFGAREHAKDEATEDSYVYVPYVDNSVSYQKMEEVQLNEIPAPIVDEHDYRTEILHLCKSRLDREHFDKKLMEILEANKVSLSDSDQSSSKHRPNSQ